MSEPLVSIIIVTYNNESVIRECLACLSAQLYQNYEVILVDNNSHDGTLNIVEEFSCVQVIPSKHNLGFTGGNILGLASAKGEYILLLNPDTEIQSQCLVALVSGITTHPEVGLCAAKLINYSSGLIDSAGDGCTTTGRGFKRGEGERSEKYSCQEYVFGACGGAVLIYRQVIEQIGFLDDDFFLIHEDTDFNFRAQLAGWKCLYVPDAVVLHKVRSSIGDMSDIAVYYSIRNSRYVWVKNMPLPLMLKYLHHQFIQEIGAFIFFVIKHHKLKAYCRANFDFVRGIPTLLKKRGAIAKLEKVNNKQLEPLLTSLFQSDLLRAKIKKMLF